MAYTNQENLNSKVQTYIRLLQENQRGDVRETIMDQNFERLTNSTSAMEMAGKEMTKRSRYSEVVKFGAVLALLTIIGLIVTLVVITNQQRNYDSDFKSARGGDLKQATQTSTKKQPGTSTKSQETNTKPQERNIKPQETSIKSSERSSTRPQVDTKPLQEASTTPQEKSTKPQEGTSTRPFEEIENEKQSMLCLSADCVKTAGEMLSRMNPDTDPCQDFYQYACGEFIKPENRPPGVGIVATNTDATLRIIRRLMPLLNSTGNEYRGQPSSAVRKLKEFYSVCMNDTFSSDYLNSLLNLHPFDNLKTWPELPAWLIDNGKVTFTSEILAEGLTFDTEVSNWQTCTLLAIKSLGFAAGALYADKYLEKEDTEKLNSSLSIIIDEFIKSLSTMKWLPEDAKQKIIKKARLITRKIGFPEAFNDAKKLDAYYTDLHISPIHLINNLRINTFLEKKWPWNITEKAIIEWPMPLQVNAFYYFPITTIFIPVGIMQMPYYARNMPESLFYGGMSFVLSHELLHAFGLTQGKNTTKEPNLSKFLDATSVREYKKRKQCFEEQYEAVRFQGFKVSYNLTAAENVADNGAIGIAYKSYLRASNNDKNTNQLLPGLNLTATQQFFLTYAQTNCVNVNDEVAKLIAADEHAPPPHRVNVVLSNFPKFSEAFNCPLTSRMNREVKCKLW